MSGVILVSLVCIALFLVIASINRGQQSPASNGLHQQLEDVGSELEPNLSPEAKFFGPESD